LRRNTSGHHAAACSGGGQPRPWPRRSAPNSEVSMKPKTILVTALIAAVTVVVLNRTGVLK
jgi:hypothetical protein